MYPLSSKHSQRKKSGDDKSEDWEATRSLKGVSCGEAKTHMVKTRATQCHLWRLQKITQAR